MPHEDRDRRLWLFNSLEFSGNPKWLFHYVVTRRPDIEAYWIADTEEKAQRVRELGYRAVSYRGRRSLALQRRAGVGQDLECRCTVEHVAGRRQRRRQGAVAGGNAAGGEARDRTDPFAGRVEEARRNHARLIESGNA